MSIPPVCVILAGGKGTRLNALAWNRAKPAVPFAGIHRLIDFTLSNSSNAGIQRVGILTQYLPLSLMDHIGDGSFWDMAARTREIRILPPQEGASAKDWYLGTAHAIYQNLDFITRGFEKEVLILSGDHIYYMDYRQMIEYHREKKAHFTVATLPVPAEDCKRFGIAVTNRDDRIVEFQEKPDDPKGNLGSMGIYVVDKEILIKELDRIISQGQTDIGGNLIPSMVDGFRVFAHRFEGYWRDVGTLDSYWDASMDLLNPVISGLDLKRWDVRTNWISSNLQMRPPIMFGSGASAHCSFISQGCTIEGTVKRSILSPGVIVAKDAVIEDSILLHDCFVGRNARLKKCILDKEVQIGESATIGISNDLSENRDFPGHLNKEITLIGKRSVVPSGAELGVNCLVFPEVRLESWKKLTMQSGETLAPPPCE